MGGRGGGGVECGLSCLEYKESPHTLQLHEKKMKKNRQHFYIAHTALSTKERRCGGHTLTIAPMHARSLSSARVVFFLLAAFGHDLWLLRHFAAAHDVPLMRRLVELASTVLAWHEVRRIRRRWGRCVGVVG
jgi:hypothetical protein